MQPREELIGDGDALAGVGDRAVCWSPLVDQLADSHDELPPGELADGSTALTVGYGGKFQVQPPQEPGEVPVTSGKDFGLHEHIPDVFGGL